MCNECEWREDAKRGETRILYLKRMQDNLNKIDANETRRKGEARM